jgi:hypothetical protein
MEYTPETNFSLVGATVAVIWPEAQGTMEQIRRHLRGHRFRGSSGRCGDALLDFRRDRCRSLRDFFCACQAVQPLARGVRDPTLPSSASHIPQFTFQILFQIHPPSPRFPLPQPHSLPQEILAITLSFPSLKKFPTLHRPVQKVHKDACGQSRATFHRL